jgi:uncharacterized protein YcfL
MPDFTFETPVIPLSPLSADRVIRWIVGEGFGGISQSPTAVRVHHDGALTGEQTLALTSVLQTTAYGLTVVTDKASVSADDVDTATISVSGAAMASDASVSYRVYVSGTILGVEYIESEWATGTAAVTGGVAALTFKTPQAGRYHIIVRRTNALHIGRVEIAANAP